MNICLQQNLEQRLALIQKLELRSDMLENCFVRSESLLRESKYQKGLELLRKVDSEEPYRGILDWLLGVFVPSIKPDIFNYYDGCGARLIEQRSWSWIDGVDRKLVLAIRYLATLREEFRMQQLRNPALRIEMTAAEVDLALRPMFPTVVPMPVTQLLAA